MPTWREDCALQLGVSVGELVFGTPAPGGWEGENGIGVPLSKLTGILGDVGVHVFTEGEVTGLYDWDEVGLRCCGTCSSCRHRRSAPCNSPLPINDLGAYHKWWDKTMVPRWGVSEGKALPSQLEKDAPMDGLLRILNASKTDTSCGCLCMGSLHEKKEQLRAIISFLEKEFVCLDNRTVNDSGESVDTSDAAPTATPDPPSKLKLFLMQQGVALRRSESDSDGVLKSVGSGGRTSKTAPNSGDVVRDNHRQQTLEQCWERKAVLDKGPDQRRVTGSSAIYNAMVICDKRRRKSPLGMGTRSYARQVDDTITLTVGTSGPGEQTGVLVELDDIESVLSESEEEEKSLGGDLSEPVYPHELRHEELITPPIRRSLRLMGKHPYWTPATVGHN